MEGEVQLPRTFQSLDLPNRHCWMLWCISEARSSTIHNVKDAAAHPTNESTNHMAKHEKLLRNKVQYRDRKLNTQDEKIDELTMEVMTHEEK